MEIINASKKEIAGQWRLINNSLKKGGIIVYPTETSYGLGCDATNKIAVKKVFLIKNRNFNKPVSLLVGSLNMAKAYVKFDNKSLQLAKKYWPGPLTLVLPKKNIKKKVFIDPLGASLTIGIRISPQPIAQKIIKNLKRPLVTTSANISGDEPAYSLAEIIEYFKKQKYRPDYILDYGRLKKVKTSTVAKVANNKIIILRQGIIKPSLK